MNRYTGELWHHGIQGQKWGVRRYQNSDGTLTELGRKHYGYGPPREKREKVAGVGSTAKNLGHRVKEGVKRGVMSKIAEKMPFMFTDEELAAHEDRMRKENSFRQGVANKKNIKKSMKGENFLKNLLENSVKTATNNVVNEVTRKAANRLAETNAEKRVRQSKERRDIDENLRKIEENMLKNAQDQNKRNLEENIDEISRNSQENRKINESIKSIDKQIRSLEDQKNNTLSTRRSGEDINDYFKRRAQEKIDIDRQIDKLKDSRKDLSNRSEYLTKRSSDLTEDSNSLRKMMDQWQNKQGGGNNNGGKRSSDTDSWDFDDAMDVAARAFASQYDIDIDEARRLFDNMKY